MKFFTFRKGGIHPPECKLTAAARMVDAPVPGEAVLLMNQHIGAPATPCVAKGDRVERGQAVGQRSGAVSAAVHTPVSGVVTAVEQRRDAFGIPVMAVVVKADPEQPDPQETVRRRSDAELDSLTPAELRAIAADAGLVGLGGATFPAAVKLDVPAQAQIDVLIVNGAECEPYLTCDHSLMLTDPAGIAAGAALMARAVGARRTVIAVEANKPDAIAALHAAAGAHPAMEVAPLRVKYPQGGEKQLIAAVTGREVPSGALPWAVGAVIHNVATARAMWRAAAFGEPLAGRIVTVTGQGLTRPGNYRAAIGTPLSALLDLAGGLPESAAKIVAGGPMMGRAIEVTDAPLTKGMSGLLVLDEHHAHRREPEPCVRCSRCVSVCPMGLEPYLLARLGQLRLTDDAARAGAADCLECGSCVWVCPAARPLTDYIRMARRDVAAARRRKK